MGCEQAGKPGAMKTLLTVAATLAITALAAWPVPPQKKRSPRQTLSQRG
jgi:hypothetical protein